jgi:hypothetical protein
MNNACITKKMILISVARFALDKKGFSILALPKSKNIHLSVCERSELWLINDEL